MNRCSTKDFGSNEGFRKRNAALSTARCPRCVNSTGLPHDSHTSQGEIFLGTWILAESVSFRCMEYKMKSDYGYRSGRTCKSGRAFVGLLGSALFILSALLGLSLASTRVYAQQPYSLYVQPLFLYKFANVQDDACGVTSSTPPQRGERWPPPGPGLKRRSTVPAPTVSPLRR